MTHSILLLAVTGQQWLMLLSAFARVDSFSLTGQAESNLASANKCTQVKSEQQSRQQRVSLILLLALSNPSDPLVCCAAKQRSPSLPKSKSKETGEGRHKEEK